MKAELDQAKRTVVIMRWIWPRQNTQTGKMQCRDVNKGSFVSVSAEMTLVWMLRVVHVETKLVPVWNDADAVGDGAINVSVLRIISVHQWPGGRLTHNRLQRPGCHLIPNPKSNMHVFLRGTGTAWAAGLSRSHRVGSELPATLKSTRRPHGC